MNPLRSTKDYAALARALCRPDGESEWVEYKRNRVDPVEIGQYISALANAAALNEQPFGYLLWGVEDGTGKLVGTTFDPHVSKKGNEPLQNWLLRLLEPQVNFSFHEVDMDSMRIILLEVDPARNIPVRFSGLDYIRVGSVTKPLRDVPERERALWRLFDRTPFEKRSTYVSLSAEAALGFLDWPAYLRLLKLPVAQHPAATAGTLAFEGILEQTGGDSWSITNFGALLLAEYLSDFPHLERKAVRVIQYPDKSRIETTRERVFDRGYIAGFEELIDYVDTLLPTNEVIGNAIREVVTTFPRIAVRELIANMLVHQDLAVTGAGPMVEIFSDRIEISNPGESLVAPDRLIDAPPRTRNEAMAAVMRRVGICEERGSGIDKVMRAIELAQLPAPLFETPPGATRVVVFAHRNLRSMSKTDRVRAVYQHACLRYVMGEKTNNATLRERFGISTRNAATASRLLGDALAAGKIVVEDPEAGVRRRGYLPFWAAPPVSGSG